jgi:hypothetical protein
MPELTDSSPFQLLINVCEKSKALVLGQQQVKGVESKLPDPSRAQDDEKTRASIVHSSAYYLINEEY